MRTCTGCRAVEPQAALVRIAVQGSRLEVDLRRQIPGRGAYVHPRATCVTIAGLARTLRRSVTPGDVRHLVTSLSEMSSNDDNLRRSRGDLRDKNPSGLGGADAVETPSLRWDQGRG